MESYPFTNSRGHSHEGTIDNHFLSEKNRITSNSITDTFTVNIDGYSFGVVSDVSDDMICTICRRIMVKPNYSSCGCRYCRKCIEIWTDQDNTTCPGKTEKCFTDSIDFLSNTVEDTDALKKIECLVVKCPSKICNHKCQLKYVKKHISSCSKGNFNQDDLSDNTGCSSRGQNIAVRLKNRSPTHLEQSNDSIGKLEDEVMNFYNILNEDKEKIVAFMKERIKREDKLFHKLHELQAKVDSMSIELQQQRVFVRQLSNQIKEETNISMPRPLHLFSRSQSASNLTMERQNITDETDLLIPFIWKISNVMKIKGESERSGSLFSDSFYRSGYNVSLRAHLNGLACGKNTHLSVYFGIRKGVYDGILTWPMNKKIRISVMDQTNNKEFVAREYSYNKTPDEWKRCFNKPKTERNSFYGHHQFALWSDLMKNSAVYKDDSIALCCKVYR